MKVINKKIYSSWSIIEVEKWPKMPIEIILKMSEIYS